jgi:hypothetical protein
MGKYRGSHQGKTRGYYEKALLFAETKNEKQAFTLDEKVSSFLFRLGYPTDENTYFLCNENDHHMLNTYHIAGATVTLSGTKKYRPVDTYCLTPEEIKIAEQERASKKPYVQIYMVSNQGLSDIIAKIKDEYPIFKERPTNKKRYF